MEKLVLQKISLIVTSIIVLKHLKAFAIENHMLRMYPGGGGCLVRPTPEISARII